MEYCVVYIEKDRRYLDGFYNMGCVDGDRQLLLEEIKNNPNFCRDKKSISYEYFLQTSSSNTCLYIKKDEKILGSCAIVIKEANKVISRIPQIWITGICVPDLSIKGIGSLLLGKIKQVAIYLGMEISLSADSSVKGFYDKNGFIVHPDEVKREHYDDLDDSVIMIFRPTRGGNMNRKSKKERNDNRKTKRAKPK